MHPSLEHLQKILKNEISLGYANKSIIGGLPKMLSFWEPNARRTGLDSTLIETIAARLRAYPDLPLPERPAAVEALLALMAGAAARPAEPAAPSPSPARPEPAPRAVSTSPDLPETRKQPPEVRPAPEARRELTRSAPAQPPAPPKKPETPPPAPAAGREAAPLPPVSPAPPLVSPAPPPPVSPTPPAPRPSPANRPVRRTAAEEAGSRSRGARGPSVQPLKADTPQDAAAGIDAPLTVLNGIGPERQAVYAKLGIETLRDLLLYFPRRYDNYSAMKPINRLEYGEECSVIGAIVEAQARRIRGGQATLLKVVLSDATGQLEITFFNQPWLADKLKPGRQIVVSGRMDQYLGRPTIVPDEWEDLDQELLNTGRIVPVYRLTNGLTQRAVRKVTGQVAKFWAPRQPDPLPAEMVRRAQLLTYAEALAQIHFPDTQEQLDAARHRLAFDELLLLQLGALRQRRDWQTAAAVPLAAPDDWLAAFVGALPYPLTGAQQRALADIRADLGKATPMNRLLQGDVGSGKTVVAATAMAIALQAGAQAALMAPTSILAEQHYRTLLDLLPAGPAPLAPGAIRLLQGSTPAAEKEDIYAGLRSGAVQAVVGTHALLEAPVEFARLGLAVVDEQHRFGVAQRAALRSKGGAAGAPRSPHLLVMTATPIPRSLALTLYGDLDLSVLDEMPPGRQPIETHLLRVSERERGYAFVRSQVQKGRQAFIIFPLVEESDKIDAKAAVAEHQRLQTEVFGDLKLGLLHGRLKPEEKEAVMARFRAGDDHILVSTSVVEVGVDIPNATVMLVEGANRFGLAQLHQFRGRVGRGPHPSTCLLVSDAPAAQTDERLRAMEQSQDGFFLAQKDLDLRGPGDFLGTRQAGFAGFTMARLSDLRTVEKARREAEWLFERDPDLASPDLQPLAQALAKFWTAGSGDVS